MLFKPLLDGPISVYWSIVLHEYLSLLRDLHMDPSPHRQNIPTPSEILLNFFVCRKSFWHSTSDRVFGRPIVDRIFVTPIDPWPIFLCIMLILRAHSNRWAARRSAANRFLIFCSAKRRWIVPLEILGAHSLAAVPNAAVYQTWHSGPITDQFEYPSRGASCVFFKLEVNSLTESPGDAFNSILGSLKLSQFGHMTLLDHACHRHRLSV